MNILKEKTNNIDLIICSLCISLLCACSYIAIPFSAGIVLSLHSLMVNLTAFMLKPKNAGITVGVYLLMGLVGLPVFTAGTSGTGKLFGPTGGFYFGFLLSVILMSALKGKTVSFKRYLAVSVGAGTVIQHFFGIAFFCLHNGFNLKGAFSAVSLPFIPGDIVKCIISSYIAVKISKVLKAEGSRY